MRKSKEAPLRMAITEPCILLSLWQQETHDGTDVPECQLPILSLW